MQLLMDVGGMSAAEADGVRRAFAKSSNGHLVAMYRSRFLEGAMNNGVDRDTALRIWQKVNGQYMFPESHSHAFGVTAFEAAWLKRHYPLEFFVALMNNQPMGFYPVESIKQDARRFGVPFLNPCVNSSQSKCIPENGSVLLGLGLVKDVGPGSARLSVEEREARGPYIGAGDLVRRTGLRPQAVESLVMAGAFDRITPNPQAVAVGRRSIRRSEEERSGGAAAFYGGLYPKSRRLLGGRANGGRVPDHGDLSQGTPHAVRQAGPALRGDDLR